jgi:hypothetical protein
VLHCACRQISLESDLKQLEVINNLMNEVTRLTRKEDYFEHLPRTPQATLYPLILKLEADKVLPRFVYRASDVYRCVCVEDARCYWSWRYGCTAVYAASSHLVCYSSGSTMLCAPTDSAPHDWFNPSGRRRSPGPHSPRCHHL